MIGTRRQLDEAILSAIAGGSSPLDPLLYTREENPPVNPMNPGKGLVPAPTGEGGGAATVAGWPLP